MARADEVVAGALISDPRFTPLGGELDRDIESVAVLIDDRRAFCSRAAEVASRHDPSILPELKVRFHRCTSEPPGFTVEERGFTGWLSAWQFAIFEIVYPYRERAIPFLWSVALGPYDWTQANAIELLCRLAAEGVDREEILEDLKEEIPELRDTTLLYVAEPLLRRAKGDPAVQGVLTELRTVEPFDEAVRELLDEDGS